MILLDTHAWVWWVNATPEKLSQRQIDIIENSPRVGVSVTSCLEVAWLVRKNRIRLAMSPAEWFELALEQSGVECLPLTPAIAERSAFLSDHHKDPIDRIIIATTLQYDAHVISFDEAFRRYEELQGRFIEP